MKYLEAIELVEQRKGNSFDYRIYCCDPNWDIQMLVEYLDGLERSLDNDYYLVLADIEFQLDSCAFDKSTYEKVIKALGLGKHIYENQI